MKIFIENSNNQLYIKIPLTNYHNSIINICSSISDKNTRKNKLVRFNCDKLSQSIYNLFKFYIQNSFKIKEDNSYRKFYKQNSNNLVYFGLLDKGFNKLKFEYNISYPQNNLYCLCQCYIILNGEFKDRIYIVDIVNNKIDIDLKENSYIMRIDVMYKESNRRSSI